MAAEKVVGDLREYKNIDQEIRRLGGELKLLRVEKKKVEARISQYISENNLPGVRYDDVVVLATEKTRRIPLKKKEKEANALEVLQSMGVGDAPGALARILESMRGEEETVESISIRQRKG